MSLRIHALYHVDFEDLGFIEQYAKHKNYNLSFTHLYKPIDSKNSLPNQNSFDWLIVMGGPMSVYDEAEYPWLVAEKKFIKQSIEAGKTVIGVCLGAQLIAEILGTKVAPSGIIEIGWMPIELTEQGKSHYLLQGLPQAEFNVFHWHGDGFECPEGAIPIATSKAWQNQGFIYQNINHKASNNWVLAWQCHFEVTQNSMADMLKNGKNYLESAINAHPQTVQPMGKIVTLGNSHIADNNAWLSTMLDRLAAD